MRSDYRLSITIFVVFLVACVLLFNVFWVIGGAYVIMLWSGMLGERSDQSKIAVTLLLTPLIVLSFFYLFSGF